MQHGKGLEKSEAIQSVGAVMYPFYFSGAHQDRNLALLSRACCGIDRLAFANIAAILETKIITDQNRRISRTTQFSRKHRIYPHIPADQPLQGAQIAA